MNLKRILVLTDHMPWGHRSIAKAIYGNLEDKAKGVKVELKYAEVRAETGIGGDAYVLLYRYLPKAHRLVYKFSSTKISRLVVKDVADRNVWRLKKLVNQYKPDLIISAYFLHSQSLQRWRETEGKDFKLWTVVADPWTSYQAAIVEGADLHLVYDEVGVKKALDFGIEKDKVLATGWWTRKEMFEKKNMRQKMRKSLGFDDERPVIFVGGGSLGTNSLAKFLPVLLLSRRKIGVIFNTGKDKVAFKMVKEYMRLLARLKKKDKVLIKNLGWIENMAEILSAVDIVFGKAGPNFMFDAVAAEKPFVAITHIGGQEDGNLEIIKKKKLGWVKEKNTSLLRFFRLYLKRPSYFHKKYEMSIHAEAIKNKGSGELVWKRVKKDLGI